MKVLKFGAVWCPGCLVMRPRWKKIEEENPWLETEYYDFDNDKEMVEKHKVGEKVLPVFVFLGKNGQEITRRHGEPSKEEILKLIEGHRNK